jgi:hypothetical protein
LFSGKLLAALHRGGGELGLGLVAADDEHQHVLARRLAPGHVHEAPRHAHREGDHVERREVDVLLGGAFVPLAAPAPRDGDEGLVGVVVVHERPLAGARLAIAEVEALGDGDRGPGGCVVAYRRGRRLALGLRRLKADDRVQLAAALGQRAVGQAAVGPAEPPEAGDPLQHRGARPCADLSPVLHVCSRGEGIA